jgi:predicted ATPase
MREKRLLLVLDNWEHVLPAAGLLNTLLAAAPDLQVLATSREPLNLQEEWLYWVTGLDTPGDGEAREVDSYSAVRLFLQSARRTRPGFRLGDDNRRAVAHICRMVDGLPLAIEMATAWLRGMSCDELAGEIERGLDVFTSPLRNAPERQRSLRAVFEYSWQLLTAKEQRLLARLSVFRGGFSREAALTVVDAATLELTGLVAKSLLTHTVSDRYTLHDLVRQFAAEKLALVRDEETHTRQQHSAYYLSFMERRAMALRGRASRVTIAEIWREADNVREAWRSAVDASWLELLERGQESLATFYEFTGLAQEGEAALERAIVRLRALPAGKEPSLLGELLARHARMLAVLDRYQAAIREAQEAIRLGQAAQNLKAQALGGLAWGRALMHQLQSAAAQAPLEQAVALARAGGLTHLEGYASWYLGSVAISLGDQAQAQAHLENARRLCHQTDDQQLEVMVRRELGLLALQQRNYPQARRHYEQSLRLAHDMGFRGGEGAPLGSLGNIAMIEGHYAQAKTYYQQVLDLARETGHRFNEMAALSDLADLALKLGDTAGAQACCLEVLALCREVGNRPIESRNLTTLARTYHLGGQDEAARQYSLQAAAVAEEKGARGEQAEALTCLGHALAGLALSNKDRAASLLIEAAAAYQQSRALWQEVNRPDRALEALAGLAAVLLAQREARQAQAQVDQILQYLESHSFDRAVEPFRVRLTCYHILRANGDPRASAVLRAAHTLLGEQAAKVGDEALRRSFLENIPAHREIVQEASTFPMPTA